MGLFSKIKRGLGKAAKKVGRGVKKTAKKVGRGVKKGVKGIGKAAKAVGKVGGKIGKGIYKVAKKGVAFGLKIVGNTALLPLVPFIPMMRSRIKAKGKAPNKSSLLGLAKQFRKVVLQKESYDCYDGTYFSYDDYKKNYIEPMTAMALVKLIMGYINGLKQKQAEGGELTETETKTLEMVEEGEKAVIAGATEEAELTVGKWINKNKVPIAIGVGLLITTIIAVVARRTKPS